MLFIDLLLYIYLYSSFIFFFFNDTATTEIYTLSLHDALPILIIERRLFPFRAPRGFHRFWNDTTLANGKRSEEHTSELQSQSNLVCRLLLEKKKKKTQTNIQLKHNKILLV